MNLPDDVRKIVRSRANSQCEYCLLDDADAGFSHEIDHVVGLKHGGSSELDNLAWACYLCNRYKGSDIGSICPATGNLVRLFHPRRDKWRLHFRIGGPIIEPLTDIGAVTSQLLRMNFSTRVIERRLLQSLNRYPRQ